MVFVFEVYDHFFDVINLVIKTIYIVHFFVIVVLNPYSF